MEATVGATEGARRLKRSLQQVHRLLWAGSLKATKVDGKWRIPVSEIEKRLRARREAEKV
jgi:hypothetical protein